MVDNSSMYDEKIQMALFEEIYRKQGGTIPVGLDLCDPARASNFNWLVDKRFVRYTRGMVKPVEKSCVSGMFYNDDISITDDGEKHYYYLCFRHCLLALEYKNTSLAEESLKTAQRSEQMAKYANRISLIAVIITPILSLLVMLLVQFFSQSKSVETKLAEFICENISVENCPGESIISILENLKPCPICRATCEIHAISER